MLMLTVKSFVNVLQEILDTWYRQIQTQNLQQFRDKIYKPKIT